MSQNEEEEEEGSLQLVGIDLGGTAAKLGLVRFATSTSTTMSAAADHHHDGMVEVVHSLRAPLPAAVEDRTPEAVLALLQDAYHRLLQEAQANAKAKTGPVAGVGVGFPGQARGGVAVGAANLSSTWRDVPLAAQLQERLSVPMVTLMNDADAALLGEVAAGAAKGRRDVVMITLGTGIGTAALLDGRLVGGSRGLIEGGHMILERGGRPCGCGQRGCWETYASATSVVARTREALAAAAAAAASEGEGDGQQASSSVLASIPPERLTAKDVFDAAYDDQRGDALAKTVVEETASALGLGCLNLCRLLDPQLLLFAGGMSAAGPRLLVRVQEHFQALGWSVLGHEVEMALATLGPEVAGVVGAAEGARRRRQQQNGGRERERKRSVG